MIRNYFIVALRNLQRNKIYSFVSIAGLSTGIACSILILLWVADEISFDRFHENYEHIYQVRINQEFSGTIQTSITAPYPLIEELKGRTGKIKSVVLTNHGEGSLLASTTSKVTKMGNSVTEDFLKVFNFRMIHGDPSTALKEPFSIVLSESTAHALFGNDDPINKMVKVDNKHEVKVTGVIQDVPAQSSLQFDFLLPFGFYKASQPWVPRTMSDWNNFAFKVYVELHRDADVAEVNNAISDIIKMNSERAPTAQVLLHAMSDWRLYSEYTNGKISGGMIEYVRMFFVVGIFILVIACINFMNLATARSQSRAREVGIRKSAGSLRRQLVTQFLGESVITAFIAFLLALVIVELVLPFYNLLVNKKLLIDYTSPSIWLIATIIILATGVLAGSYPAFYLSSFQPVKVLKGDSKGGRGSVTPRKVLVVVQFGFSIFLIIATLVIYQQIQHVKARHAGYDRENMILIWTTAEVEANFNAIREDLKASGVVKGVCKSSAPITRIFSSSDNVTWPGKLGTEKVAFTTLATEYGFTETMGIKMLQGRDFSPDFKSDTSAVIINKAAVEIMALQNPIGEKIQIFGGERTIIGVMEDVIMDSPFQPVQPLCMVFVPEWSSTISIRLEASPEVAGAIADVEKIFKKYDPEHPLWYRFADEEFQLKFASINLVGRLALIFTGLAIVISCLGLFGLAAFTAEQRTKEVGIRKVMGASVSSLVLMISHDFSKLVILSFLLASPIAWWLLERFLEDYPYRIDMPFWTLPLAGAGSLILTIAIVSIQALKAATINPGKSLRSE